MTIAIGLGLVVVLADLITGEELSFSIFYVAPISIVAWRLGRIPGLVAAAVAATAWYVVELLNERVYSQSLIPLWNGLVRLGFFAIITQLLVTIHEALRLQEVQARLDPLTGLLNRRGFVERAEIEFARSERAQYPVTIGYFDIDEFKRLNDTAGHAAGDEALREAGSIAIALLRRVDVVGRMGGDEFALLLPETAGAEARLVVERLRIGLAKVTDETGVGFSFGVVTFERPPGTVGLALDRADALMYAAKVAGPNAVRYATEPVADSS